MASASRHRIAVGFFITSPRTFAEGSRSASRNTSTPQHETPGNPWTWRRHWELFFDLLRDGEVDVEPLVSHREPYTSAPGLYEMLLADRSPAMGVALDWS